ncbi:pilus assembly FimT family protein [Deinococcus koreensis]|uniref:General secretion pathway GspH domain-containing protein n=1 Tax=Deinococcus koreensis TaxID=2054903 RepID=A0A2K3V1J8_9DEIO|nr:GspH/FimT family pseudopilin [Deinococcus koreensis]PNY82667.1 hypothetical protein CVO96_16090 [Deinococcus koreensis]
MKHAGVTLIEMLVVLMVIGILAGLTTYINLDRPDFNRAGADLLGTLQKARFEAVRQNRPVVVNFVITGTASTVQAFVDLNDNGVKDYLDVDGNGLHDVGELGDSALGGWTSTEYRGAVSLSEAAFGGSLSQSFSWQPDGTPGTTTGSGGQGRVVLVNRQGQRLAVSLSGAGLLSAGIP